MSDYVRSTDEQCPKDANDCDDENEGYSDVSSEQSHDSMPVLQDASDVSDTEDMHAIEQYSTPSKSVVVVHTISALIPTVFSAAV